MNNNAIPFDWKRDVVVPIYKGGDRSVVGNYRPVSLASVVCKQMGARYNRVPKRIREIWVMSGWLCGGQHGFTPGYSCEVS